eukprot:gene25354-33089_t
MPRRSFYVKVFFFIIVLLVKHAATLECNSCCENMDNVDEAYRSCKLPTVLISTSTTSIGKRAFQGNTALTNLILSTTVQIIMDEAFADCTSLTSLVIPTSVTYIGVRAFEKNSALESIFVPTSLVVIMDRAFADCKLLTVTIARSVTFIGVEAFRNNPALSSLVLMNTDVRISNGTFLGCLSQMTVTVPTNIPYNLPTTIFPVGSKLENAVSAGNPTVSPSTRHSTRPPSHAPTSEPPSEAPVAGNTFLTNLTLSTSVVDIMADAFSYCGLTSLVIPT